MDTTEKFLGGWEKVRQNTIATVQDMPEEHYDQAPFEDIRSFHQQLSHVLHVSDVLFDALAKGEFDRSKFAVDNYATK